MEEISVAPLEFEAPPAKKKRKKRVKKVKEVQAQVQIVEEDTGEYKYKGAVKEYSASSRASVKIPAPGGKDNIYTFEASATMYIPDGVKPGSVDLALELKNLFDMLNAQVDDQIGDTEASLHPQN